MISCNMLPIVHVLLGCAIRAYDTVANILLYTITGEILILSDHQLLTDTVE